MESRARIVESGGLDVTEDSGPTKVRWLRQTLKGVLLFVAFMATLVFFFAIVIMSQIPSREAIRGCVTTKMYAVELCPGSKSYVPLARISKHLQQAVVVTEDSAFYDHRGFDFQEIQRSFEKNLEQGRFARGGSTITQQLAKNMFLSAEKSLQRKLMEALITIQLEKHLTKREILERYLNVVQFGPKIFGVKAAAQFYFKKTPAELDLIESAWLAFLLPSPDKYSVSFFKKQLTPFARKRLRQIVGNMYRFHRAGAADYRMALARLDRFLVGGEAVDIPDGLDLDAPEEEAPLEFLPEDDLETVPDMDVNVTPDEPVKSDGDGAEATEATESSDEGPVVTDDLSL